MYPLVLGLEDLLNWLRVGSHFAGLIFSSESETEWMIVDDGFGSLKMYTHKFPRKLVLVDVDDGAFKIRSK